MACVVISSLLCLLGRATGVPDMSTWVIGTETGHVDCSKPLWRFPMKVAEAMSRDVRVANPDQSICEVACSMAEIDAGAIPVGEDDRLVGMITDRDIAVRAVAAGKGPDTPVREVMTQDVKYCFEDESLDHVAK